VRVALFWDKNKKCNWISEQHRNMSFRSLKRSADKMSAQQNDISCPEYLDGLQVYAARLQNAGLKKVTAVILRPGGGSPEERAGVQLATPDSFWMQTSSGNYDTPAADIANHNCHMLESLDSAERAGKFKFVDSKSFTLPITSVDPETALGVFCDTGKAVVLEGKQLPYGPELSFELSRPADRVRVEGGWKAPYTSVNVVKPDQKRQRGCVFPVAKGGLKKLLQHNENFKHLALDVMSGIAHGLGQEAADALDLMEIDLLFQYDRNAHFTYHRDTEFEKTQPVYTVVVLISPNGSAGMHVAGAEGTAEFCSPGDAHLLPSDLYHRTDTTTYGTVKATLFYAAKIVIDVSDTGLAEPLLVAAAKESVVKTEKPE
jgi:hypothetical protein